jgi:hypothetical protein
MKQEEVMRRLYSAVLPALGCGAVAACATNYEPVALVEPAPYDVVVLGRDYFDFNRDREIVNSNLAMNVDAIAIKPLDGDARCSRVTAIFRNGAARDLDIDDGRYLMAGREYWLDLPGNDRYLQHVDMTCRPAGNLPVTLQVLASR